MSITSFSAYANTLCSFSTEKTRRKQMSQGALNLFQTRLIARRSSVQNFSSREIAGKNLRYQSFQPTAAPCNKLEFHGVYTSERMFTCLCYRMVEDVAKHNQFPSKSQMLSPFQGIEGEEPYLPLTRETRHKNHRTRNNHSMLASPI